MGVAGLALASSISAWSAFLMLSYSLRKKIGRLGAAQILNSYLKFALAAFIMGVLCLLLKVMLAGVIPGVLLVFIIVSLGAASYWFTAGILKINEREPARSAFLRK